MSPPSSLGPPTSSWLAWFFFGSYRWRKNSSPGWGSSHPRGAWQDSRPLVWCSWHLSRTLRARLSHRWNLDTAHAHPPAEGQAHIGKNGVPAVVHDPRRTLYWVAPEPKRLAGCSWAQKIVRVTSRFSQDPTVLSSMVPKHVQTCCFAIKVKMRASPHPKVSTTGWHIIFFRATKGDQVWCCFLRDVDICGPQIVEL
jgi:hypothetical protein